jgi:hypothetical protein
LISSHFLKAFPQLSTPSIEGIFISSFSLGNLVGCILTALLGDWLGRKKTLWTGALISATGGILQAAAYSFPMLMLGRVVSGLGNGINRLGPNRAYQILMMTRHDFGDLRCIPGGGNPRFQERQDVCHRRFAQRSFLHDWQLAYSCDFIHAQ